MHVMNIQKSSDMNCCYVLVLWAALALEDWESSGSGLFCFFCAGWFSTACSGSVDKNG